MVYLWQDTVVVVAIDLPQRHFMVYKSERPKKLRNSSNAPPIVTMKNRIIQKIILHGGLLFGLFVGEIILSGDIFHVDL